MIQSYGNFVLNKNKKTVENAALTKSRQPFHWLNDTYLLLIICLIISLFLAGWHDMHTPWNTTKALKPISLNPIHLPYLSLRTTMRLIIGLFYSFTFSCITGWACAKYKAIARVLLPFINFLESAPLVGFLAFTTTFFLFLFPNNLMGLESAAIFAVFTSQAWNMALVIYQTIRIIPQEYLEISKLFKLNNWQKFWRIELPFSIPGLLWNTMVSQSAAWFALVATESIPVHNQTMMLPGIGSYIQIALEHKNVIAILYAILAIMVNIILLDQLLFRPLMIWAEKFNMTSIKKNTNTSSWIYSLFQKSFTLEKLNILTQKSRHLFLNYLVLPKINLEPYKKTIACLWYCAILLLCFYGLITLWEFVPHQQLTQLLPKMLYTTLRVVCAMLLSIIVFTPLGIWLGLNAKRSRIAQPIIQILAALPPDIYFPLIVLILIGTGQSLSLWSIPLIMTGTLWYILFNVIAGVQNLPQELLEMTQQFKVTGWQWWVKFIIPAIFPYIVTGIISAAGGAWNSAIACEFLQWGTHHISTQGIGAYIAQATADNKLPQAALGCFALCSLVAICVAFIWKPLYQLAENKYKL